MVKKTKLESNLSASVIIPVYNTEKLIEKNLPKVIATAENKKNKIIEVIVVDDASSDDSAKVVDRSFPEVKLVKHKVNRGFSASINTGARSSKGKLLVLLNSDVIPDNNFLFPVFKHFKRPEVFAVSLHERAYTWARGYFEDGFIGHEQGDTDNKPHETFWVNGGSGVFRRDYWMKLKGMDEKLLGPFYWEDIDLSYRAAKRGLVNLWEPKAKVTHKHETTMSQLDPNYVNKIRERNQLLFIWKNITSPILFRKHITGLFKRLIKHPGYIRIVILAMKRLKLVLKARKKEKSQAKVSDEAIFARFA